MRLKDFLEYADCKGVTGDDARLWLCEVGGLADFERSDISSPLMFIYVRLRPLGRDKEAVDGIERAMLGRPKGGLVFTPRRCEFKWPTE